MKKYDFFSSMGTCVASNSRKNNEQENVELEMRKYIRKGMVMRNLYGVRCVLYNASRK